MKDINLKELWKNSEHETPNVEMENIGAITNKTSLDLVEQFKKRFKKWLIAGVVLGIIIVGGYFKMGLSTIGIILSIILIDGVLLDLFMYRKILLMNYNQEVLNYLIKFRRQLKYIKTLYIIFFILGALVIIPAAYIIAINSMIGNSQVFQIYNLLDDIGFWVGLLTGETIAVIIFVTVLYRLILKPISKIDQRIEEIKW